MFRTRLFPRSSRESISIALPTTLSSLFINRQFESTASSNSSPPTNKGILKTKTESTESFQKYMQGKQPKQQVPKKANVIPLHQRFNRGGGIAKPEVEGQFKAHPIDFDVHRGGSQLRIKWRLWMTEQQKQEFDEKQQQETQEESSNNIQSDDQFRYITTTISAELMRVCAPSTDVLSLPDNVVVSGKRGVKFEDMHLVGNYALRVSFTDGHTAGIYGYQYLYDLSGPEKWLRSRHYLTMLKKGNRSRDPIVRKQK